MKMFNIEFQVLIVSNMNGFFFDTTVIKPQKNKINGFFVRRQLYCVFNNARKHNLTK